MHNYAPRNMLPVLALLCLSGCAKENFDSASAYCLPLVPYDTAFQQQLAEEIDAASPDAAFPLAVQDYASLRAGLREACK